MNGIKASPKILVCNLFFKTIVPNKKNIVIASHSETKSLIESLQKLESKKKSSKDSSDDSQEDGGKKPVFVE